MERLAQRPYLEIRVVSKEVPFAEVRLAEGEVDECAEGVVEDPREERVRLCARCWR